MPAELSSFIGRRRELASVRRLVAESRLATLTGFGGVGKTRLAQRVAAEIQRAFPDGVFFIDLTTMRDLSLPLQEKQDPEPLAHLIATDLGLPDQSTRSRLRVLTDHFAGRHMLLILDNCEHLMPACAVLSQQLLLACPSLWILATSRGPLGVTGEVTFPVPPLATPDPTRRASLPELLTCESVALFTARAQAISAFRLTEDNKEAVVGICHRLDGLPLALELAASWVRALEPQAILERLGDRYRLLQRGAPAAPDRQQTLWACVDWSYQLCNPPERLLWARLSAFVGGHGLDAIEGICTDEQLPEADLLGLLAGLMDKSVVDRDDGDTPDGYRMLETLREYGQEQLAASGEEGLLRRRHRDWYGQLVARAAANWNTDQHSYWHARLGGAHANLSAAVDYCLTERGEAEAALQIAVGLPWLFRWGHGLLGEGRQWLDLGLARVPARTCLRARALLLDSELALQLGDAQAATRLLEEGEQLGDELEDLAARAHAAFIRGLAAAWSGRLAAAMPLLEQSLAVLSKAPHPDPDLRPRLLEALGITAALVGDHEHALGYVEKLVKCTEPRGENLWRCHAVWIRALVAWRRGEFDDAVSDHRQTFQLSRKLGLEDPLGVAMGLEALAWVSADLRRPRRAATLLGAADSLLTGLGISLDSFQPFIGYHRDCEQGARGALGEEAYQDAVAHGRALTYDNAVSYALEEHRSARPAASMNATPLTPRELEVAGLIAKGLTNKEIAAKLVISRRTAEAHVEHILNKLGFTSRAQVSAWVTAGHGD